jgi:uncharacterized protein with HEPN domain
MPSDRSRLALFDIRDNVRLARAFVDGLSEEDFEADRRTFYAVTRCLEIISEAAPRLSPETRAKHPDLPWRAIMGVGNVYRHDYGNVAEDIAWRTVQHSLAPLLAVVEVEIAGLDARP